MLAKQRSECGGVAWPTTKTHRKIDQLPQIADGIAAKIKVRNADLAARERVKHLATVAANPPAIVSKIRELADLRTIVAYTEAANLVADLREALANTDQALLADEVARKLKADCPRYHTLMRLLRERGILPK